MAPHPSYDRTSSRHQYRPVVRVFLGSLIIGFALIGAVAWSVDTVPTTKPAFQMNTAARPAAMPLVKRYSAESRAKNFTSSVWLGSVDKPTFDAQLFAPPVDSTPQNTRRPVERTSETASLQQHSLPVPQTRSSRTAIYDIAAHTVYMPNGRTLEAHSGLGRRLDDPRYVAVKDQGPTPPNVYELTLREKLFHKVRAIRLIPIGNGDMFGRDGMLAHSYMRGASGQSNGCVSFKNYPAFLRAYLKGDVDRLVVVRHMNWRTASAFAGSQLLDTD